METEVVERVGKNSGQVGRPNTVTSHRKIEYRGPVMSSEFRAAEMVEEIFELAEKGKSIAFIADQMGVSEYTFYNDWPRKYPEFAAVLERAKTKAKAYWDNEADNAKRDPTFIIPLFNKIYQSRFENGKSKIEIEIKGQVQHVLTSADLEILKRFEIAVDDNLLIEGSCSPVSGQVAGQFADAVSQVITDVVSDMVEEKEPE